MVPDLNQWALIVGAVVPVLVGLLTKANASAGFKAVMLLTLELINGVLVDWFGTPNGFDWKGALVHALVAWLTGVASYYGLLRHTVTPKVVDATARFGLGGTHNAPREDWHQAA